MKITDVRTTLLTGPCTNDPFLREARKRRSAAFIEVITEGRHIGIGETYAGYFCPEAVPAIVEFFKPILIGQTVDDIPELWRRMYHCGNFWCRVGLGVSVLNGIEAAEQMRQLAPDLPIILSSGYSAEADAVSEARVHQLPKPYSFEKLEAVLRQATAC